MERDRRAGRLGGGDPVLLAQGTGTSRQCTGEWGRQAQALCPAGRQARRWLWAHVTGALHAVCKQVQRAFPAAVTFWGIEGHVWCLNPPHGWTEPARG